MTDKNAPTSEEIAQCIAVLKRAEQMSPSDPAYLQLEQSAAFLRKTAKKRRREARAKRTKAADAARLRMTGLSQERFGSCTTSPATSPATSEKAGVPLKRQHYCYVCHQPFRDVHHYFDKLCIECGDRGLTARDASADLRGRRALVTGGRIKVGYAIALRLLRDGADVQVTTRFPADAARRYAREADFEQWRGRLCIRQADFRYIPALLRLIEEWNQEPAFDILINNAAQTVWRPPEYYEALWAGESQRLGEAGTLRSLPNTGDQELPDIAPMSPGLFPLGEQDAFGDPLDLRRENSWIQSLGDIRPSEFIESQVVNAMAPYLLCSELKPSLLRSTFKDRYIINVAAAEGQFARPSKPSRHPHTNMAKAALNMLTCTSAKAYAADGIFMVSVDPGWVSHEVPEAMKAAAKDRGFHTPLAMVDAAARLYHPILRGLVGEPIFGVLLKDYRPADW